MGKVKAYFENDIMLNTLIKVAEQISISTVPEIYYDTQEFAYRKGRTDGIKAMIEHISELRAKEVDYLEGKAEMHYENLENR